MKDTQSFGYCRCSSKEQNADRQVLAMLDFGLKKECIVVEKMSGKNFIRPKYNLLMDKLKPGDIFVIKSIDRLGRNYKEIVDQWRYITNDKQAEIIVLDLPLLDTRKKDSDLTAIFISDVVLQILSYVAETERDALRLRQSEGIAAAKQNGKRFGRPQKEEPDNFEEIVAMFKAKKISLEKALALSGLTRSTFYRRMKNLKTYTF